MSFIKASSILVPSNAPAENPAIFLNSVTPLYEACGYPQPSLPAPGVWTLLDLTPSGVPSNAVAVDLRGILIITDGSGTIVSDLAVAFQKPGGPLTPANYVEQTIGIGSSGGARTNADCICPCLNGCIEWSWYRGSYGEWPTGPIAPYPTGAAYGLNISVQAVYLP